MDYCCGGTADTAAGNAQLDITAQDPADDPVELPPQADSEASTATIKKNRRT
jgi:hypothetical protein